MGMTAWCMEHEKWIDGYELCVYYPVLQGRRFHALYDYARLNCGCEVNCPKIEVVDDEGSVLLLFEMRDGLSNELALAWSEPREEYEV